MADTPRRQDAALAGLTTVPAVAARERERCDYTDLYRVRQGEQIERFTAQVVSELVGSLGLCRERAEGSEVQRLAPEYREFPAMAPQGVAAGAPRGRAEGSQRPFGA